MRTRSVREEIASRPAEQHLDWQTLVFVLVGRLLPLKGVRMETTNGSYNLEPGIERLKRVPVEHVQLRAAAKLARELVERRLEIRLTKMSARQSSRVQFTREVSGVDPRRAENFEWPRRAAAFRDVGPFEQTHPGVDGRGLERRHVRRWEHPRQAAVVEPHW